jgi:hypothetical protein
MKKISAVVLALLATFAFCATAVASASAATLQWLANGSKITAPLLSESAGEFEVGSTNIPLQGGEVAALCSFTFVGTTGPNGEDLISEVLTLADALVSLSAPISCVNIARCKNARVAPENLPWLTELELAGSETAPLFLDRIVNGGKGEPTWWIECEEPPLPLLEVECVGQFSSDLENDPMENDVLGTFSKTEQETEGLLSLCKGEKTGFVTTGAGDEVILMKLTNNQALSVSYE